jgi:hypothetical protein
MSSVFRLRNILSRSWFRIAPAALAALVLTAVPALAITRLGAAMFSSGNSSRDNSETRGAREIEEVASSPLTFDAPSLTVMRASFVDRAALAASGARGEELEPATVVDDWKFTRVWRHRLLVPFPMYIFNSTNYNFYNYGNYYASGAPGSGAGSSSQRPGSGNFGTLIQLELQQIQLELMQIQLLQQIILTELSQLRQFLNRHSHSW